MLTNFVLKNDQVVEVKGNSDFSRRECVSEVPTLIGMHR